jgi:hypothetical protein
MSGATDWLVFSGIVLAFILLLVVSSILGIQNDRLKRQVKSLSFTVDKQEKQLTAEYLRRVSCEKQLSSQISAKHRKDPH